MIAQNQQKQLSLVNRQSREDRGEESTLPTGTLIIPMEQEEPNQGGIQYKAESRPGQQKQNNINIDQSVNTTNNNTNMDNNSNSNQEAIGGQTSNLAQRLNSGAQASSETAANVIRPQNQPHMEEQQHLQMQRNGPDLQPQSNRQNQVHRLCPTVTQKLMSQAHSQPLPVQISKFPIPQSNYPYISLICQLCEQPMVSSIETNCGHAFCEYCLTEYMLVSRFCPTCKCKLKEKKGASNKRLDELVEEFCRFMGETEIDLLRQRKEQRKIFKDQRRVDNLTAGMQVDVRDEDYVWRKGRVLRTFNRINNQQTRIKFAIIQYLNSQRRQQFSASCPRIAKQGYYTNRDDIPRPITHIQLERLLAQINELEGKKIRTKERGKNRSKKVEVEKSVEKKHKRRNVQIKQQQNGQMPKQDMRKQQRNKQDEKQDRMPRKTRKIPEEHQQNQQQKNSNGEIEQKEQRKQNGPQGKKMEINMEAEGQRQRDVGAEGQM